MCAQMFQKHAILFVQQPSFKSCFHFFSCIIRLDFTLFPNEFYVHIFFFYIFDIGTLMIEDYSSYRSGLFLRWLNEFRGMYKLTRISPIEIIQQYIINILQLTNNFC